MNVRFIAAVVLAATMFGMSPATAARLTVTLTPRANAAVPWRPCIAGTVSDANAIVKVLVRPLEGDGYWVQPPVTIRSAGDTASFVAMVYIAEYGEQFRGQRFEVIALANPRVRMSEGDVFADLPDAEARSRVLDVVRDDDSSSGCGLGGAFAGNPLTQWIPRVVGPVRDFVGQKIVVTILLLVFGALVVLRHRVEPASAWMDCWLACGCHGIRSLVKRSGDSVAALFLALTNVCRRAAASVCSWTGTRQTTKTVLMRIVLSTLFAPLLWLAAIADARTTLLALGLVFQVAAPTADPTAAGLFGGMEISVGKLAMAVAVSAPTGVVAHVLGPLADVWNDPLGPFAIGLTAIQAVFGAIVLWGIGQGESVRMTLRSLYASRPIPTTCFLALTLVIAVLAGYRGYELSPNHIIGWVPAAIAGLLGLVTPPILAYALHYFVESFTDWTAVAVGGAAIAIIYSSGASVLMMWCALLAAAVGSAVTLYGFAIGLRAALGLYFWMADLFGELVEVIARRLADAAARRRQAPRGAWNPTAAVSTAVTIAVLVLSFSLSSCAVPQAMAQESIHQSQELGHDPGAAFNTWALCIDTSRSVRPDQFVKMQRISEQLVDTAITFNDLVWLIEIHDRTRSATLYEMPRRVGRRTQSGDAADGLQRKKGMLIDVISHLQQRAATTDLGEPVRFALTVLATQPAAVLKTVVIGSDFISDAHGTKTAQPPQSISTSAAGMRVALIVTEPTDGYLATLKLTGMQLFAVVQEKWVAHFTTIGAARVTVQPADAVPVSRPVS